MQTMKMNSTTMKKRKHNDRHKDSCLQLHHTMKMHLQNGSSQYTQNYLKCWIPTSTLALSIITRCSGRRSAGRSRCGRKCRLTTISRRPIKQCRKLSTKSSKLQMKEGMNLKMIGKLATKEQVRVKGLNRHKVITIRW